MKQAEGFPHRPQGNPFALAGATVLFEAREPPAKDKNTGRPWLRAPYTPRLTTCRLRLSRPADSRSLFAPPLDLTQRVDQDRAQGLTVRGFGDIPEDLSSFD